jgi:hypothetical protein
MLTCAPGKLEQKGVSRWPAKVEQKNHSGTTLMFGVGSDEPAPNVSRTQTEPDQP